MILDAIKTYWLVTKRVGPRDSNDVFYGRFSVVLLAVSQLVILAALYSAISGSLNVQIGRIAAKAVIIAAAVVLAILDSILLYGIDDLAKRGPKKPRHRLTSNVIIILYFSIAAYCWFYLLG